MDAYAKRADRWGHGASLPRPEGERVGRGGHDDSVSHRSSPLIPPSPPRGEGVKGPASPKTILCAASFASAVLLLPATVFAADTDPCDSLIPAAIGGPLLPKTSETAVFRWLAQAKFAA